MVMLWLKLMLMRMFSLVDNDKEGETRDRDHVGSRQYGTRYRLLRSVSMQYHTQLVQSPVEHIMGCIPDYATASHPPPAMVMVCTPRPPPVDLWGRSLSKC